MVEFTLRPPARAGVVNEGSLGRNQHQQRQQSPQNQQFVNNQFQQNEQQQQFQQVQPKPALQLQQNEFNIDELLLDSKTDSEIDLLLSDDFERIQLLNSHPKMKELNVIISELLNGNAEIACKLV